MTVTAAAAAAAVASGLWQSMKEDPVMTDQESSAKAAINTDSRMYNTLTFLDDESDEGDGSSAIVKDRTSVDQDNKTTEENNVNLDNQKTHKSDVNDNPQILKEENQSKDQSGSSDKKKIVPNFELLQCVDFDLNFSAPRDGVTSDPHLGNNYDTFSDQVPDESSGDLSNPVFDPIDDWGDDLNDQMLEPIPEYSAREEHDDVWNWRPVDIAGITYRIDMKAIEPYRRVLSHGGYYGNGLNAIVVFAACYLPDRSRLDYCYIMDNLFLYVVSILELLVVDDYTIIYFHSGTSRNKVPALRWLKRCYNMIDHRLRKNLQRLLVVHPTFFLKTVVLMTRPFFSSKFASKLHYVRSLSELSHMMPTEYIHLPEEVKQLDRAYNPSEPIPQKKFVNL